MPGKGGAKRVANLWSVLARKNYGAVVSWGFEFDEINVDEDGEVSVMVRAWANQNVSNVYISGKEGELADLLDKFPFLDISGHFEGEYGSGEIEGYDEK